MAAAIGSTARAPSRVDLQPVVVETVVMAIVAQTTICRITCRCNYLDATFERVVERLRDDEMDAWQALLHAHQKIVRRLDAELREEHGLGMSEYDVLLRLARAERRTLRMSDLAERVMFSPSGLTRVVDRLSEEGLVARRRDPADARVVLAELTPSGRERLRAAALTHLRGIRQHFAGRLSSAQLRELAAALQVITGPHVPH
jgi:DNA-binding MarR family transcriptional regulator